MTATSSPSASDVTTRSQPARLAAIAVADSGAGVATNSAISPPDSAPVGLAAPRYRDALERAASLVGRLLLVVVLVVLGLAVVSAVRLGDPEIDGPVTYVEW